MYCRFCGTQVLEDSLFCSKCGKKLRRTENPRWEKISKVLRLRTPYPYALMLVVIVVLIAAVKMWTPQGTPIDYQSLQWTLESNRKLDLPAENLFQQGFSLVLANAGSKAVKDIPVDFVARIEPEQPANIAATFQGNQLEVMKGGRVIPLTIILSDELRPGSKRSFLMEGSIAAQPPFKVTYEFREEGTETVLANLIVER